jgi:hypothetical protein
MDAQQRFLADATLMLMCTQKRGTGVAVTNKRLFLTNGEAGPGHQHGALPTPGKRTPRVSTAATSGLLSTPINQRLSYTSRLVWQAPPSTGKSTGTPTATPGATTTPSGALALSVPTSPASESAQRAEAVLKMVEVSCGGVCVGA